MADVIIIGGGAAGLFAAGLCGKQGVEVTLVEHMEKYGKKLAITGKGRCNITNNCDEGTFLQNVRSNPKFLYSAIYAFPPSRAMAFFENELDIKLMEERGRRVFPKSERAEEVVNALVAFVKNGNCNFTKGRAKKIIVENNRVKGIKLEDGRILKAENVVLATGGISYPVTGSTGIGHKMAKETGHTIINLQPSLVSLVTEEKSCSAMSGLSLKNVKLTLLENGKKVFSESGEMLFTHFGVSGPLVLTASAYIKDINKKKYTLSIDLKPALSMEQLEKRILRDFEEMANRNAANCLDKLLPASMRPVMVKLWGIDADKKINQISKKERNILLGLLKNFPLTVASKGDLSHAVITAGGVSVKEIEPKTMESKIIKGLYFAGELIDVDAYTGGYNLQIAWSTAYLAANDICGKI